MVTWETEDALPYVPAVTVVLAIEIVPVVVIGPPVRPVPVAILVTVQLVPPPLIATVFNMITSHRPE